MNTDYLTSPSLLPQPNKHPIESAVYKSMPADFVVKEIMEIDFTHDGEHLWLEIEKTGMNTTHLAKQLATWAKIPQRDVGYSGIKDRNAVTTQWFSLRIPKKRLPESDFTINDEANQEFATVLRQHWHNKKLNRSTHKHNYFKLVLRKVIGNRQTIDNELEQICKQGVPNYFGEQRFGREGNNIATALEWFEQGTIHSRSPHPKKSRDKQSILLSAARSAIFNQILAKRVTNGSWQTGLDGEVFNLAGSGAVFTSDSLDDELRQRITAFDIHPTGSMWGKTTEKSANPISQALQIEQAVVKSDDLLNRLAKGLENKQIKASRRPLRLLVQEPSWRWYDDKNTLELEFILTSGSYATSVLQALII